MSSGDNTDLPRGRKLVFFAPNYLRQGVVWQQVDQSKYRVLKSDLYRQVEESVMPYDSGHLPYDGHSLDGFLFDPPYMHGGGVTSIKESLNKCYLNANHGHESVVRLYASGLLEAVRVLKRGGILIVKCQDEIESSRQRLTHCELITLMEMLGFEIPDLFLRWYRRPSRLCG